MTEKDAVIVIFSKEQVRHKKLAHFLKQYGPDALPAGQELGDLMGAFDFLVGGYDDDPAEIYSIPEARTFYQHFHKAWPYWFYFCSLHTETLQMMTMCMLPNLKGFKRLGAPEAAVEYDPMELIRFIQQNFVPLNQMMERAGKSEMDIYNRTGDIMRYYGLPFDVPPPPAVG